MDPGVRNMVKKLGMCMISVIEVASVFFNSFIKCIDTIIIKFSILICFTNLFPSIRVFEQKMQFLK